MIDKDVTIYGLKTCDTCRKAMQMLKAADRSVEFVDIRATPVDVGTLSDWLSLFGDALVNTRSTTWRGLNAQERTAPPLDLLRAHPALMKRPVIVAGDEVTLGWTAAVQQTLLPSS